MPPLSTLPTPRLRPGAASRRPASWIALLALLVGALVPTLSRLAQPAAGDAWQALCQARGSSPADPAGPHEFGDACALCTLAHTAPGLAGPAAVAVAALAYAPPAPPAPSAARVHDGQARPPGARGPPGIG
jgi:hypothetical protein